MSQSMAAKSAVAGAAAAAAPRSSSAASSKVKAFVTTFSITGPVVYCLVVFFKLPLLTYFPAIERLVWGAADIRPDTGPNMLWYGFTLTTILISSGLGLIAMMLPDRVTRKMPLALLWILPILAIPYVIYSLMFWWRLAFKG
jgi:heme/copper-type cytochrome/quinol oxidase subunit 3